MKYKRFWAALLSCALLAGCGAKPVEQVDMPEVQGEVVTYVPLDDRPDNAERVVYLANSLGYQLAMPEEDWYRTKLDHQPLNANGTQYGDRGKLYEWVMEQEKAGCDRYILFLDQLLSGGLVNSRHISGMNPVTLSDGMVLTEEALLLQLMETLAADGENRVWLLDTVMRLAPTCGYDGFGIDEYNQLREYAMQPRPVLDGEALTVENILADYRLGADGTELNAEDYALTGELVDEYLAARERKLRLTDEVQRLLMQPEYDRFRLLTGIDDSSAEDSIQKNEIALLKQNLREDAEGQKDWVLSGVDDLAFKAVTRLYLDEHGWTGATADVEYYGGTENRPACAYDSQPLEEIVAEHFAFFDLRMAENGEKSNFAVMVLTQPEKPEEKSTYYETLIQELNRKQAGNIPVVLIDAANNQYGTAFHDALTKQSELGKLISYAGFLDMAIVTGTALSHGVARYAWLAGTDEDSAAERAFRKSVAEAILLDFCYRNTVRDEVSAWVRAQGGDPNNFYAPEIDLEAAQKKLEDGMTESTKAVLKNLERSNLLVSLDASDNAVAGWGDITLSNWRFPWQRVFEVRMDLQIGDLTEPHKSILGIYYQ